MVVVVAPCRDRVAGMALRIAFHRHGPGHGGSSRTWPQKFFPNISRSVDTSSNFFSFPFSSSRCLSRLASDTSMPPNFERHL